MKKRFLLLSLLAVTIATTITSCSNDDDFGKETAQQKGVLAIALKNDNIASYKALQIEALEINTGAVVKQAFQNTFSIQLELPYGSYKISANGTAITKTGDDVQLGANLSVDIKTGLTPIEAPFLTKQFTDSFIIEEAFYTGVKTPDGKNYNSSRYFKIVNNTNKVLYADNLIIGQSEFLTSVNHNVTPYSPDQSFAVKGVMVLRGSGNQYPVQPGDFIVVADNAVNHNANTSTAFDLSKADFEFPATNPKLGQVDNPNVPNADIIYTQMDFNMFFLHSSGVESYILARFPDGETSETFLANYKYSYSYTNSAGGTTNKSTYQIPNSWILDGMNNAVQDKLLQMLTSSSIDSGWTGVGAFWNDANRLGKSVRRKVDGKLSNGKDKYKDTNNSTEDFIKNSEPSLKSGIVH